MTAVDALAHVRAQVNADGTGTVTVAGADHDITAATAGAAREQVLAITIDAAQQGGAPIRLTSIDPDGTFSLIVHPDGSVTPDLEPAAQSPLHERAATFTEPVIATGVVTPAPEPPLVRDPPRPSRFLPEPPAPATRAEARRSFLTTATAEKPATHGWRGLLTRLGIRMKPGPYETELRKDEDLVSGHWPGPRTIAVVNGKGGASKTTASILLAAVFARYGGAGVLAWDNNQTRGTLGWRTEQGSHDGDLMSLLPQTQRLLGVGAQSADLSHFVHHQAKDKYDVLRSRPSSLANEQRFASHDVDAVHNVASKFYRIIIMDSGNDETDPMWREMIARADLIVVATTQQADRAETGALLLEELERAGGHGAALSRNAIVVVSQQDMNAKDPVVEQVRAGFEQMGRTAVTIPYDPGMVDGPLKYDALRPATQRAWLRAAARVADRLA